MNYQNQERIKSLIIGKSTDQKPSVKMFEFMGHSVAHENRVQVEKTEVSSASLELKNYLASIQGDKIVKRMQLQFQGKIVKIIDEFTCTQSTNESNNSGQSVPEQEVKKASSYKKLLGNRFTKIEDNDEQEGPKGRDVKNVVKNIFRLFQNWAADENRSELLLESSISALLEKHKNFNNSLIVSLSKDFELRRAFQEFGRSDGEKYIQRSRIQSKQIHLQALRRYCKLCQTQQKLKKAQHKCQTLLEIKQSANSKMLTNQQEELEANE